MRCSVHPRSWLENGSCGGGLYEYAVEFMIAGDDCDGVSSYAGGNSSSR